MSIETKRGPAPEFPASAFQGRRSRGPKRIPRYTHFAGVSPGSGDRFKRAFHRSPKGSPKKHSTQRAFDARQSHMAGRYDNMYRFFQNSAQGFQPLTAAQVAACRSRTKSGLPWNTLASCSKEMGQNLVLTAIDASPIWRAQLEQILLSNNKQDLAAFIVAVSEQMARDYVGKTPQQSLDFFIGQHGDYKSPTPDYMSQWLTGAHDNPNFPGVRGNTARKVYAQQQRGRGNLLSRYSPPTGRITRRMAPTTLPKAEMSQLFGAGGEGPFSQGSAMIEG
jgi:hypothetical protein